MHSTEQTSSANPISGQPTLDGEWQAQEATREKNEVIAEESRQRFLDLVHLPGWIPVWVPILASLISLAISLYTFFVSTEPPDVLLIAPQEIRLAQVSSISNWAAIYMQTTFVSTGVNGRAEVIPNMYMDVKDLTRGETVKFRWREQGTFKFEPDPKTPGSFETYVRTSDPLPLLVSPSNGQAPVAVFQGPDGWAIQTGEYEMTLVADRAVNSKPLTQTFKITVTDGDMSNWQGAGANMFFTFTVEK